MRSLVGFKLQDPKICIMKSLPKPYKYVYINFNFMMSVYGESKSVLVLPHKIVHKLVCLSMFELLSLVVGLHLLSANACEF